MKKKRPTSETRTGDSR